MFSYTIFLCVTISSSMTTSCWQGEIYSSQNCSLSQVAWGEPVHCLVIWKRSGQKCGHYKFDFAAMLDRGEMESWEYLKMDSHSFGGNFLRDRDDHDEMAYEYDRSNLKSEILHDITIAFEISNMFEKCLLDEFKNSAEECLSDSDPWPRTKTPHTHGIPSSSSDTTAASLQTPSSYDGTTKDKEHRSSNMTIASGSTAGSSDTTASSESTEKKRTRDILIQTTREAPDRNFTVNEPKNVAQSENFEKRMPGGKKVESDSMNVAELAVLCIMGIIFWLVLLFMHWEYYATRPQYQSTSDTEHRKSYSDAKSNAKAHLMKDRRPNYVYKPKTSTSRESHRYQNSRASFRPAGKSSAESTIQDSKLRKIPGSMKKFHEPIHKK